MKLTPRIAIAFAIVAAAAAAAVGWGAFVLAERVTVRAVDESLELRLDGIVTGQRLLFTAAQISTPPHRISEDDISVQLVDLHGHVTFTTSSEMPVLDHGWSNYIDLRQSRIRPGDLRKLVHDQVMSEPVTISHHHKRFRIVAVGIKTEDFEGSVQVVRDLDEVDRVLEVLRSRIIGSVVAASIAGAIVGIALAGSITLPLRRLTMSVREVGASNDFELDVPSATRSDEVGELADGFKEMLANLSTSRAQQTQLVQNAAHELRTPLTSIRANVDYLGLTARRGETDPQLMESTLSVISSELTELSETINEIIEVATDQHELAPFEQLDLADVALDAIELFTRRSGRLVSHDLVDTPCVGDPAALRRAIANLLSNAGKYSPHGTKITVEVAPTRFVVSDAGEGIPEEDREMVWQRFYRRDEDRAQPGSGLGLSIVANIVSAHNGEVFITESALGGSAIGFELPSETA